MLHLSEKVKVLILIGKERKSYAWVANTHSKNKSPIHEIMTKEKEICASFAVAPQTAKITVTVHDKGLVKMGKASRLCMEDQNRKRVLTDGNELRQRALSLYQEENP